MNNYLQPRRISKKKIIRIGILIALLLSVLFFTVKFVGSIWLNSQRGQLEHLLTDATGLKTRIKGTVTATFFPTPGISLGGISMEYGGKTVVAASSFAANFDLRPLFDHKLIPHQVDISGLWLQLPADEHGKPVFTFKPGKTSATVAGSPFGLQAQVPDRIELHNSTIVVRSPENKELHTIKGLNLAVYPVRNRSAQVSGPSGHPGNDWQLKLYANFEQAKFNRLEMGPTRLAARFGPREGSAEVTEASVFDGSANGKLSWKYDNDLPEYSANLTLSDFDAGKSVLLFRPSSFIQGRLNVSAELTSKGSTLDQIRANVSGSVKMEGADLALVSTNLDEVVNRIISSQQYNLADAAAYFFIGPLAVSATKGLDAAKVVSEFSKTGNTHNRIKRIHTSWTLSSGVASAQDVALQTERYLLALRGRINLSKQTFDNVEIGVINHLGCAIATQKFSGPIASPSMEKTNLLVTLTRPLLDALTKSAKGVIDSKCDSPFYRGALLPKTPSQPKPAQKPETTSDEEHSSAVPGPTEAAEKPASQPPTQPGQKETPAAKSPNKVTETPASESPAVPDE